VRTIDEVYAWAQTRSQGLVIDVDHVTLGRLQLAGPPLRFFDTDGQEITRTSHTAPPTLDGNGADVPSSTSR
jgi:formyl-CoA transferase